MLLHSWSARRWVLLAATVALVAAISCAEGDETATPGAAATPTTSPAVADPSPTVATTDPGPTGNVVIGLRQVIPPLFVPEMGGAGLEDIYAGLGIVEFLINQNEDGEYDPNISLAESWTLSSDQSHVTFTIRQGVPFHGDWGDVTAEDVVWSHNNALADGSTFWGVSGIRQYMDRWEATDERTAVMHFSEFNPRWERALSNISTHQPWVYPKAAYDELGAQRANSTPLGTGPFQAVHWRTNEEALVEAVVPHWRKTPGIQQLQLIDIPEPIARAAAFRTGAADIIDVDLKLIPDLLQQVDGSRAQPGLGYAFPHTIMFRGNYWAETNYLTGESVYPREGLDPTKPWVGDPRDPESMERARKVREAMSIAIDKETILQTIFGGLGEIGSGVVGFRPTDPQWKDHWMVPYDPERSRELLAEAGYENGFTFNFYVPPDHIVMVPEAGQAIAQMWIEIGLTPRIESMAYAAYRPQLVTIGAGNDVMYRHSGAGFLDDPKLGSYGPSNTFDGIELPTEIQELHFENRMHPDIEHRIANNVALQDYVSEWWLGMSFVTIVEHWMVGPRITEWQPHDKPGLYFTAPETLRVSN